MFVASLRSGFSGLRSRPGLVFLLFGLKLFFSALLVVPVAVWLSRTLADTGFDPELSNAFDIVLWADIFDLTFSGGELSAGASALPALIAQLIWAVPLYLLWSVASRVGLVQALRDGGARSFWSGVSRYTGKGLLLALLFLILVIGWSVISFVVFIVGSLLASGEVASYWFTYLAMPVFVVFGLSVIDFMHDYGRAALVVDDMPVTESWLEGIRFGFRHPGSIPLYLVWFVVGAVFLVAPTWLEIALGASVLVFLLQQVLLLLRTAVTVGWIGSEVALYETVRLRELPLLADESIPDVEMEATDGDLDAPDDSDSSIRPEENLS